MIQTVKVSIKGITPLLMHAYPLVPIEALEKKPPEEQAELAAYRDPDTGMLYIPGVNVQRAIVAGATFSKGKGRASLQKPVAACVMVNPMRISLGLKDFSLDSRPVVIPSTKGRVLRHRPRLDTWACTFEVEWDDTLLKESELKRVIDDTFSRVGILDFRPEKKGLFGRAMVTKWEVQ